MSKIKITVKKKKLKESKKNFTLAYSFLVFWVSGIASVLVDLDHIPKYIFHVTDKGRLWHDPLSFLVIACCYCWVVFALISRWTTLDSIDHQVE